MAERENFSLQGSIDDINISTDEIGASELDAFFNGDPDEIEEIAGKTKPQAKPQPKVKPVPKKEEEPSFEPEEDNDTLIDRMLDGEDEPEPEEEEEQPLLLKKKSEVKAQEKTDEPEEGEPEEVNSYQALAEDLLDAGVLTLDDGEEINITSPEALLEKFEQEGKKKAAITLEKFLGRYGDDYQEAFKAIFVDGVDPRSYYQATAELEDIETLDLTQEPNQRFVLREYYKSLKWDEAKIAAKIEKLENYGALADDAADIHQVLVQKSKDKKEQLIYQQEQVNQRKAAQKQLYQQSVTQILTNKLQTKDFDGIPVDPAFAKQTQSFLLEERYQTPDGETLTEFDKYILELKKPENFEKRVKLAMLAQLLETDPTLSKIKKKAVTEESKKTFGKLSKHLEKQKVVKQNTKKFEDDEISSFI